MCLTCGCMQAHLEMGQHNIRYEDVKAAADENGNSVAETLDIIDRASIIHAGEVLFEGTPSAVLTNEDVRRVYLGARFSPQ